MQENYSAVPSSPHGPQTVSYPIIEPLQKTRGWALFISILGFIISGLMILAGIAMIGFAAVGAFAATSTSSGSGAAPAGFAAAGGLMFGIMGAFYIAISLLYLLPALWLFRYASRISDLVNSQSELDLIAALHAQKSFWKFIGIMILATIALYIAFFVFAMIAGVFSTI